MSTTDILTHTEAGVTTLTLNRVDKKNSLTRAMYSALADALLQAQDDASVHAVVLQGDLTVFCAGNDISDFLERPPTEGVSPVFQFLHAIAAFPKPLIAAVCGPAVGIGTTMLFHCDLVHRAAEALLLGEPFMAEAAMEVGLVNRVVPPTECNVIAQAQARKLAAKPLASLIETKRLMKKGQLEPVLERMAEEGASFGRMLQQPAAREAFTAFMQKRKPDFSQC